MAGAGNRGPTTAISKTKEPETFAENVQVAKEGGSVAQSARLDIEQRIGRTVISSANASNKAAPEVEAVPVLPKPKK